MRIEDDNGISALIRSVEEERICTGFTFTEGPVWVVADTCLLFSDIPGNRIHRWRPGMTEAEVYREPSRHANGLTLDVAGNVVACEHSGRQVSRGVFGGVDETLVDRFEGKRLNSPNDVVVHDNGAVYFTDPPYGLGPGDTREIDFQGVYRFDLDGSLTCVVRNLTSPNGLTFSPDQSELYVGDSRDRVIMRYRVQADGSLSNGEVFADRKDDQRTGNFDGMKVDEDGRLWTTGPGGVSVYEADGTYIGVFEMAEHAANIAFGGPEFSTLFLTARTSVYRVETAVRGVAPGSR
ncbi:MAG: SMP-30/gluconolactonase/LRE family protein [Thermomicrobiales bacterium]